MKKNVYLYNVFDIKINVGSNKNVNIIVCYKNILKIGLVFCRFWKRVKKSRIKLWLLNFFDCK